MGEQRHSKPEPRKTGPEYTTCGQPIMRVGEAQWFSNHEKKLQRLLDRRRESAAAFHRPSKGYQL
jgi:hypothetical protein